jgi:hypothetical protein
MRARRPAQIVSGVLLFVALCAAAGCGKDPGSMPPADSACPPGPPTCPSPAPSYATQVSGIIQTNCVPCHGPGGVEATLPFATYDDITGTSGRYMDMYFQLHACKMPPPDAGQPSEADREAILAWLLCQAPNN